MTDDLSSLRARIDEVDKRLVELAAERLALVREVGLLKRGQHLPTVDFAREAAVLARAREIAAPRGLDPQVAEELLTGLIRASLSAQDEDRLRYTAAGAGKRAVVVGGAGRMGRWFARFLTTVGYETGALDPEASRDEREWAANAVSSADLVICAMPPAAIAAQYAAWESQPPAGVIVDIASIKTPLIDPIRSLRARGARVASIHPMFGPSIVLLRDADVVVCETGDERATDAVVQLFQPTTVRIVRVALEDHDRIMGDLLSLAHAVAIAFALALPDEAHPVRSTTFGRLEALASALMQESPDVYYEIQSANPHSHAALERMGKAVERIVAAASAGDAGEFRKLFEEGRKKLKG